MSVDRFTDPPISRMGIWLERRLETRGSMALLVAGTIIVCSVPLFYIGFFSTKLFAPQFDVPDIAKMASEASGMTATFQCEAGKWIDAAINGAKVSLNLSDGRQLGLPAVYAATGMKFANTDNSFVFSDADNRVQIVENGSLTYSDCTMRR